MSEALSFAGDASRLEQLVEAIGRIGSSAFRREMFERMSDVALQLVREEFVFGSADPYGNPWRPLKKPRAGVGGPLLKTGKLMRSVKRRVTFDGFTLKATAPYAGFHQNGTRHMLARKYFPDGELPEEWARRFEEIAASAIERAIGRFR